MAAESHYDQFMKLMADFSSEYLQSAYKKQKKGESPELPTDSNFYAIFNGFTEIREALETLELTELLVGLNPPRSKRIDKDGYLKFLIGAYLQEMYILEQRLTAYGKKIARLYNKPKLPSLVQEVVYNPLEGIINTRGAHVHTRRFNDERLNMVSTMALFRRMGHELGEDLEFEYKIAQRQWRNQIRANNQATMKLVDQYFRVMHVVMCKDNKIIFPPPKVTKGHQ